MYNHELLFPNSLTMIRYSGYLTTVGSPDDILVHSAHLDSRQQFFSGIPAHFHPEMEVSYLDRGQITYFINGDAHCLTPGQAILVKPNALHGVITSPDYSGFLMEISIDTIHNQTPRVKQLLQQLFFSGPDSFYIDGSEKWHPAFCDIIQKLDQIVGQKAPGFDLEYMSLLYQMSYLLHSVSGDSPTDSPARFSHTHGDYIKKMVMYVREQYPQPISVADIAGAAGISRSSCDKLFRKLLQCSPNEYLCRYRILKSVECLENGMPVTETALTCGFSNLAYFSKAFKKQMGKSPTAYRNSIGPG